MTPGLHVKQHDVTRRRELSVLTCKAITRTSGFDMRSNNMTPGLHAKKHDVTRRRDTPDYRAKYKTRGWRLNLARYP